MKSNLDDNRKARKPTPRGKNKEKDADEANSGSIGRYVGEQESSEGTLDIVDETLQFTKDEERVIIKSGKLQDIIDHYTTNATDKLSINHLVLTHPHFFPTALLIQELSAAFGRAKNKEESLKAHVQLRVVNIAKIVLDNYSDTLTLDPELKEQIDLFVDVVSKETPELGNFLRGDKEKANLDNHDHDHDDDDDDEYNTTSKLDVRDSTKAMMMVVRAGSKQRTGKPKSDKRRQPGPNLDASKPAKLHSTSPNPQLTPNAGGEPSTIIANYLPEDIAQQLCVVNFHHYSRAKFTELHHLSWTKPGKAPNLDIAAKHLDDLSLVFAYLILSEKMAAKRAKMITLILQHLLRYQNFQSLVSVSLTLSYGPIVRLKNTWKYVSSKALAIQKRIDTVLNPLYNFSSYRLYIKDLEAPLVPCYEVTLKDLLYQHETSPNYLSETVINVYKMECMGKIINGFKRYRDPYPFEMHPFLYPLLAFLDPPRLDDLDALSIALEPSESDTTESGGSTIKTKTMKSHSFQNLSWSSDLWMEFMSFINQRCSLEVEALELYVALTTFESAMDENDRREAIQKILYDFLGFNGGDKIVTISPETMLELSNAVDQFVINPRADIPTTFFNSVKKEICDQIEAAFLYFQQPKKK